MRILKGPLKEEERTSIGGSGSDPGVNGLLRFVIQGKVVVFGWVLLTQLRKLLELMMLKHGRSVARKLS